MGDATSMTRPRHFGPRGLTILALGAVAIAAAWRYHAEHSVGEGLVGQAAREATDPDPAARARAAESLGAALPPDTRRATAALAGLLRDPDPAVREAAARALGTIFERPVQRDDFGPTAPVAVATLAEACGDPDPTVRLAAVQSLTRIAAPTAVGPRTSRPTAPDMAAARPALEARLLDDDGPVRWASLEALYILDGAAAPVVRRLLDLARARTDPVERGRIAEFFRSEPPGHRSTRLFGGLEQAMALDPGARGVLERARDDPDPAIRAIVAAGAEEREQLVRRRDLNNAMRFVLTTAANWDDPNLQRSETALRMIDDARSLGDPGAIQALTDDPDPAIREAARRALGDDPAEEDNP